MPLNRMLPYLDGRCRPESRSGRLLLGGLAMAGRFYGVVQRWRAEGYRSGRLVSYQAPCRVVSVGNLTVGGTGKTPMVMWLVGRLLASGRRVAVVSRGYRQRAKGPVTVVSDLTGVRLMPPMAADEAVLLAQALPGVPVLTGPDRILCIRVAVERFASEVVVLDDGFQHLQVRRDLDLVLADARHPLGNGQLIPGGVLREPPSALSRCGAVILTRAGDLPAACETRRRMAALFAGKPVLLADHKATAWREVATGICFPTDLWAGKPIFAFCGLARPETFRETLVALGVILAGFRPFPDHHPFSTEDFQELDRAAEKAGAAVLVCTSKDAVKVEERKGGLPLFVLEVEMVFLENPTWIQKQLELL